MNQKSTRIILASKNKGKVKELRELINDPRLDLISMAEVVDPGYDVEETGQTFEENAWLKAETLCRKTGEICIADDSGLEVDALDGAPGVYSARYAGQHGDDAANNAKLVKELDGVEDEQRSGRFVCVLAIAVPTDGAPRQYALVRGVVEGRIGREAKGENGFGYDPYFYPLVDLSRTTAEMTADEKNSISHRAVAVRELAPKIERLFEGE